MAMGKPVIHVEGVTKELPLGKLKIAALRGVTFSIGAGEMVGLVGPSGSGKSTLLGILGGLDSPTAGRVEINGVDV
ncbi:MAG: ATP-binding cassette domain-containing protein, partial [Anaerolineae bacterium]|nr:ATP-binding cassette domain-containing protein [Anaerolineae bacterium]